MSRRRRLGAAFIAAGMALGAGGFGAWQAGPVGAAELSSFDFHATAHGFSFFNEDASGARQGEGTVPYSLATLQNGPVGLGRSTIAWPGDLGANAGTLLLVLQPGCTVTGTIGVGSSAPPLCPLPSEAKNLNDPIIAEARSGQNPPTTNYTGVPGSTLTATAEKEKVSADAEVGSAISQPGTFGTTTTHALVEQTGNGGTAESLSQVHDVNLGGVIKIQSVVSTAKAATDGVKGTGEAKTTVTGMTVGGQPATIDENGFRIGSANQPVNAVANQIAAQALKSGGFEVFVSTPQKEIDGSSATVTAGSIVITQKSASGVTGFILGGVNAAVSAGAGVSDFASTDLGSDVGSSVDTGAVGAGTAAVGDLGGDTTGSITTSEPPSTGSGTGQVALGNTKNAAADGKPLKPAAVVFGMLGAAFLAFGMKRLSDDVLAEQAGTTCPLEEVA